ncbi:MAG: photosystem II cytochrome c-550 [Cyanophyceae cyanobacterium]
MLKRLLLVAVVTLCFALQGIGSAAAVEVDPEIRTVTLNESGQQTVLSVEEVERGKRLFNDTCSQCHAGGRTKTNPNVGLGLETLAGAEPPKDNIVALVDYMKHPVTYDGEAEITLLHPNTERADLYPEMRNLTDEDLKAIAGHILIQPKVRGKMWGGGKVYN